MTVGCTLALDQEDWRSEWHNWLLFSTSGTLVQIYADDSLLIRLTVVWTSQESTSGSTRAEKRFRSFTYREMFTVRGSVAAGLWDKIVDIFKNQVWLRFEEAEDCCWFHSVCRRNRMLLVTNCFNKFSPFKVYQGTKCIFNSDHTWNVDTWISNKHEVQL